MSDLASTVQGACLAAFGTGAARAERLHNLRSALRELRSAYARGHPPDFSIVPHRDAYVLAYHPHHVLLSAAAFAAAGPQLLRLSEPLRVVLLGAGPAAELVGLIHYANQQATGLRRVHAQLVDREPGWQRLRGWTLAETLKQIWNGQLDVEEYVADLATAAGLQSITPLLRLADLVIVQALITELPNPLGEGALVEHLLANLGAQARMVVIDLAKVPPIRGGRLQEFLESSSEAVTWLRVRIELPPARPHPELAKHLFSQASGTIARSRPIECQLHVVTRPGVALAPPPDSFEFTDDQRAALASIRSFLESRSPVFVMHGSAGTGKTSLFPHVISAAREHGLPVTLLAPTGQAARRLLHRAGRAGSTIHSQIYRFSHNEVSKDADEPPVACWMPGDPPPTPTVYLVDEASLIGNVPDPPEKRARAQVRFGEGHLLDDLLGYALHAPESRVIFVGDPHQLPPINDELSPALDTNVLRRLGHEAHEAELNEIVRQERGSALADLSVQIRQIGRTLPQIVHDQGGGVCVLTDRQVNPWLTADILAGSSVVVAARHIDVASWNRRLRNEAGRPQDHPVPGDRLVLLRRDAASGLVNGDEVQILDVADRADVLRLRGEEIRLREVGLAHDVPGVGRIAFDSVLVEDLLFTASEEDHRRVTQILWVNFQQRTGLKPRQPGFDEAYLSDRLVHALRASYAYARTCHRAQGGEWDNVVVDFTGARSFGPDLGKWAYTAITRARRAAWLVALPRPAGPWGPKRLLEAVQKELAKDDLRTTLVKPINSGIQVAVSDGNGAALVNVFEKKGIPSSVVRTGPSRPEIHHKVMPRLREWLEHEQEAAREPLDEEVQKTAGRVAIALQADGYDVEARRVADYQVQFRLLGSGRTASVVRYYRSNGCLGTELRAQGEASLLEPLREALSPFSCPDT